MTDTRSRMTRTLLAILVVIAAIAALRATYYITMPLAAAFFTAVLVWPLHEGLRRRLPERLAWLATVATLLAVLLTLALFAGAAAFAVWQVGSDRGDELTDQWRSYWKSATMWLQERGLPVGNDGENDRAGDLLSRAAEALAISLVGAATILTLFTFYLLLMLAEARHWQEKSRSAFSKRNARELMESIGAIASQVRTFVLVQALVAAITATVTALWLWLLGIPFVLLWALLTFVVDFVPNIGPTVAGLLVTGVAFVTVGWERALATGIGVLAIQQFFGNYVDPVLKGRRMSISPLVVLLAIAFWAWVWGPIGAIIAVPLTATVIIACAHVPSLRPIALMLSRTAEIDQLNETTHSG